MSLKYRSIGGAKVLVDSADTTPGFLFPKLLVGTGLTKLIQNPGGNENILLSFDTVFGDGRYIKRAPASENQQILPTTNSIPLTIKGFLLGSVSLLEVFQSGGAQNRRLLVSSAGELIGEDSGAITGTLGSRITGDAFSRFEVQAQGTVGWTVAAGTTQIFNSGVIADPFTRFISDASGTLNWGSGAAAVDTTLSRTSAGRLTLTGSLLVLPGINQVPLTLQGFATGTSDVLQVFNSASPQVLALKIDKDGNLIPLFISLGNASVGRVKRSTGITTQSLLWTDSSGLIRIGDSATDSSLISVLVQGTQWDYGTTAVILNSVFAVNTAALNKYITATTLTVDFGFTGSRLRVDGASFINLDLAPLLFGASFIEQGAMAAPAAPAVNSRRVFVVSTQNQVSALTSAGTTVYLEGRGAPNVAVAKSATSLAITLSPAEPDTSYEIGVMPAFNSTVFYTAKATTGFTINFGTSPTAASTLDWTLDRRVSGSA